MDLKQFGEKLTQMKDEYKKAVQENGEAVVKEAARELFTQFPDLQGVRWTQYTPYFNDGDPCYFRYGWMEAKVQQDEDYEDTYSLRESHPEMMKAVNEFEGMISGLDDALEVIFGDHAMVTVTRDEITVEEYDHD